MNNSEIAGEQYFFLQKSFHEFNQATERLQNAFANLEQKFEEINKELELRNEELRQTIAEKEKVKNYLRNILESLTNGVVVTDLEGRITSLNRCAETFFGASQEHVIGTHVRNLFHGVDVSDWRTFPHTKYLPDGGTKIHIKDKIMEIFVSPMQTEQNDVIGTVYILRDITRVEKLEEMAKRTEKLAAMGEMAANIAHEIRNPLGSIELFTSLLMKDLKNDRHHGWLSHIITSVKNMDNKISNLLLFTTQKNPVLRAINLHRIMNEVIQFSDPIIKQEGITLSVKYTDGEPCISGDEEMLKQVFLNILLNSIQAMTDGGALDIETIVSHKSTDSSAGYGNVEIRISDTGVGISKEDLKRIFDPFFSTREKGSGLGLAIVHNIIHIHGGSIDVENREKRGTTFSIILPLIGETS